MSIALVRVDDRLVHGQVVVGWGRATGATRVALVDDAVRESEWEQELYRTGVPPEIALEFVSVADAPAALARWAASEERTIVLVGDIATLARMCEASDAIAKVNLGGIHSGPGRTQRLPYVYLSEAETAQLNALAERGVAVTAQDVPTAAPVALERLT
ncbi:MAG TPA: PTS sugar transporter subunit IIB [Gemmatimonadales bacterium]|nr:PTS sugar transporter subunit IIB [Gemmatimonadales bacterium]